MFPGKLTKKIDQSDSFPHHIVSLQNSYLFLRLAKEMKINTSQNMEISQHIFSHNIFYQIEADFWYEMLGKLRLTSGGKLSRDHALKFTGFV